MAPADKGAQELRAGRGGGAHPGAWHVHSGIKRGRAVVEAWTQSLPLEIVWWVIWVLILSI